ncbi:unnamed protein product [Adineta steineri]|uniref:Hormone-sensitive lipase n=1 Tax=Adineta steineri TaxID=433720 RepID=A0A813U217_9BILA|nr:unnamed protein product [Adineta steineri]CAF3784284.1 unnamed protein product [Adineta steineri]
MHTNEELSPDGDSIDPKERRSGSFTDRLSIGPIAAASRLMSSLTRQSRNSIPTISIDNNEKSSTSSSFFKPITKHILPKRNRSISPKSPLSAPNLLNTSPFAINSTLTLRGSSTTPSGLNHISKSATTSVTSIESPSETVDLDYNFDVTYKQLSELAEINCNYFSQQTTDVCRRFERLLIQILHSLELSVPLIQLLTDNFHYFDYSPEIRANGYRTLVTSHGQASLRTLDILRQVDTKRVGLLFNLMYSSRLFQDLESWTKVLIGMQHLLSFAVKMISYSENKNLCIDADKVPLDIELDYFKIVAFDSEYFFGRTCGFQFAQSMQTILTFLLAGLATYHETYNRSIPFAAASLATAPKYLLFPEQRAKKCAAIFRDCDYLFCKSFWNLVDHDYIKMGSRYIAPNVTVSKYFQIGPEPIEIGSIIVPPPSAGASSDEPEERAAGNIGVGSDNPTGSGSKQPKQLVNIKLLSNQIREGMSELPLKKTDLETSSTKISPMSDQLLMHVHGGGFIATSSTTHEVYLKPWALGLDIPIVSVDYSLAPEYPFPRAIEECYYAYAWILKNASKLGWTGKTILLAGDSAGGNLITIVTIKAIEAGLRKPDAIICFYTPFLLGYSLSPSRLMAIMDPLLNTGFLWRCLAAYAGIKSDNVPPRDEISTKTIINKTKNDNKDITDKSFEIPTDKQQMHEDTYYARLTDIVGSRQAYLLRKLRESTLPNHPHMSPLRASDDTLRQFPTTYLIGCHLDPLLDDSITFARHLRLLSVEHHLVIINNLPHDPFIDDNVEFARRLSSLKVSHHITVVDEWPHGFLDFGLASNGIAQLNIEIISMLQNIIRQSDVNATGDATSVPSFTN